MVLISQQKLEHLLNCKIKYLNLQLKQTTHSLTETIVLDEIEVVKRELTEIQMRNSNAERELVNVPLSQN